MQESRKEIQDLIDRWWATCEEIAWDNSNTEDDVRHLLETLSYFEDAGEGTMGEIFRSEGVPEATIKEVIASVPAEAKRIRKQLKGAR